MVDLPIEQLALAIEKGKVRGFDEVKEINGENYYFQYALKKEGEIYRTYFFQVPEKKMELVEDYATEEISSFSDIGDAFNYFRGQGVDITRFSAIRGTLPF
ncbi:Hypothetical protein AKI40_0252 [Enterobacter sp. FY-07]|uniref:hypothetical protein n=1 Tax=Kosakonia oryzendophytica TaxID=1005665 RepID=UPI00078E2A0B|nr:hypothetical protein [Kosakonia oryzendophytica]AMO46682.1 Hypothetical protein AKI40_0252 [Enterobacter sp. FY-07]WBT58459.1 hypothetical protein O9K67_01250 [Kosakonia oryzendophytica]